MASITVSSKNVHPMKKNVENCLRRLTTNVDKDPNLVIDVAITIRAYLAIQGISVEEAVIAGGIVAKLNNHSPLELLANNNVEMRVAFTISEILDEYM